MFKISTHHDDQLVLHQNGTVDQVFNPSEVLSIGSQLAMFVSEYPDESISWDADAIVRFGDWCSAAIRQQLLERTKANHGCTDFFCKSCDS